MIDKIKLSGLDDYGIHRFYHKAMSTVFDIFIYHDSYSYAFQAASEAFIQLDLIEQDLSRFLENSDISRINRLKPGESTFVGENCMECLTICEILQKETNGAFNPTVGKIIEHWKNQTKLPINLDEDIGSLILDQKSFSVTLINNPISIDLGAIGKGYALDKLKMLFLDWDINTVLICSGRSTFLALNPPDNELGWPLIIHHPFSKSELKKILLNQNAVSGSGLKKGNHIISPSTYQPIINRLSTWSISESGAQADALSTSFMIMSDVEILDYFNNHKSDGGMIINKEGNIVEFGTFE